MNRRRREWKIIKLSTQAQSCSVVTAAGSSLNSYQQQYSVTVTRVEVCVELSLKHHDELIWPLLCTLCWYSTFLIFYCFLCILFIVYYLFWILLYFIYFIGSLIISQICFTSLIFVNKFVFFFYKLFIISWRSLLCCVDVSLQLKFPSDAAI